MSAVAAWLDPRACPDERPPLSAMEARTRDLHAAIDDHARRAGVPYLHPAEATVQQDLLGSSAVIEWQEGKAAFLFAADGCWSELPPLYARYGTAATRALIDRLKTLEGAGAAVVCDSGMQATALVFDSLMAPGAHAVLTRQVYNKTRSYMQWLVARLGGALTVVDDGEYDALAAAITPATRVVFAETFTNPLLRAQDPVRLADIVARARQAGAGDVRLVVDSTIATPWAFQTPLLAQGVDVVVASGTKALSGTDRDLWGYVATNETQAANAVMDLVAMRGGILDWRRATAILERLDGAEAAHAERSETAARVAAFLAGHPCVAEVFHPSRPDHPDAGVIRRHYRRHGSLVSFRVAGADEARARHVADVLATTTIVRYALSFDGLATKVNHHQTVSEYFTPPDQLRRNGIDRLIRLGIGHEAPEDLMAALNWALHHAARVSPDTVAAWQDERRHALEGGSARR
ncbi:MAG: PLP-dependent transferase [Vicinamibacterales bacterium]